MEKARRPQSLPEEEEHEEPEVAYNKRSAEVHCQRLTLTRFNKIAT